MALLAPSILSADFARLGEEVEAVRRGGARLVHVDVMDGHFVPNLTLGPPVVRSLRAATSLFLDCHLMVERPESLIEEFAASGAQAISIHVEAARHLHRAVHLIRSLGVRAGVAVNPGTALASIEAILADLDYVLLMSVNPGFGGQSFIPSSLDKARELRALIEARGLAVSIEMDGGINAENALSVARAGVGIVVAGSAVFGKGRPEEDTRDLARALAGAGGNPEWIP
jgi:ribulose-phosphate 3-epimerase